MNFVGDRQEPRMRPVEQPREPLTRAILDQLTCQAPGCTHDHHDGLALHGACHVKATSTVRYWARGMVEVRCHACDRWVAEVALDDDARAAADKVLACTDPHCKEPPADHSLVLRAPCHRDAGVLVHYHAGHLVVTCGACERALSTHRVAEGVAP